MGACCDECLEDATDPADEHACAPSHSHVHEEVTA